MLDKSHAHTPHREAMASESLNAYSELGFDVNCLFRDFGDIWEANYSTTEAMHAAIHSALQPILQGKALYIHILQHTWAVH
jgi:hypothetical protein